MAIKFFGTTTLTALWNSCKAYFVAKKDGFDLMSAEQAAKLAGITAEAKKVEASETNGNVKIDGVETKVFDDTNVNAGIKANADALEIINSADVTQEGSLAKVANDASVATSAEKTRAEAAEKALADNLGVASTEEAEATGLHADVEANASAIATINGDGAGSIKKAVADEATARDEAIATAIANANGGAFEVVTELPSAANAKAGVIYLIKDETVTGDDKYAEYVKVAKGDGFEVIQIGETSIDLSDYAKSADYVEITAEEVAEITGVTLSA